MIMLSKNQIILLHKKLIVSTGGLDGLRDEGLLESAISSHLHTFEGVELYPSIAAKIARITYSLVNNHAFVDGNKRIGIYVMLVLLELNDITVDFSDGDLIRIGLDLAGGKLTQQQLLNLIVNHSL